MLASDTQAGQRKSSLASRFEFVGKFKGRAMKARNGSGACWASIGGNSHEFLVSSLLLSVYSTVILLRGVIKVIEELKLELRPSRRRSLRSNTVPRNPSRKPARGARSARFV
eukprot:3892728-Rhodomonas_salina.1